MAFRSQFRAGAFEPPPKKPLESGGFKHLVRREGEASPESSFDDGAPLLYENTLPGCATEHCIGCSASFSVEHSIKHARPLSVRFRYPSNHAAKLAARAEARAAQYSAPPEVDHARRMAAGGRFIQTPEVTKFLMGSHREFTPGVDPTARARLCARDPCRHCRRPVRRYPGQASDLEPRSGSAGPSLLTSHVESVGRTLLQQFVLDKVTVYFFYYLFMFNTHAHDERAGLFFISMFLHLCTRRTYFYLYA